MSPSIEALILYSGYIFTILSTAVALFSLYRERKYRHRVQIDNWSELKTNLQANAQVQIALKRYLESPKEAQDSEIVRRLSASDAFGQEVTKEIIRRIHYSEPRADYKQIQKWRREGKLGDSQADMFIRIALDPRLPDDVTIEFEKQKP